MASYCSVDDVCTAFPQFKREEHASIKDNDIQGWIDQRKARIRSVLLSRQKFDPDAVQLTVDQANFLRGLNVDGVIADLADAMAQTITLQPGETLLSASHRKTYEAVLKEIQNGLHDVLFQQAIARSQDVQPLFGGIGGAEMPRHQTPGSAHQTRYFGISQRF